MKILVTGATGFLGRHLLPYLKNKEIEVIALNSKNCNLTDKTNLLKYKDPNCDRIYHLAAWTKAGDFCLHHKGEQWIINQQINTNILWYWQKFHPSATMVTMGTSCAYPPELELKEENYMVSEPDKDLYTYAMTKRMLYEGVKSLNHQFGMDYSYLIPSTLYGPLFDPQDTHFIFDLIKKIVAGKKENKKVSLWGNGYQIRELIYIDDALNLIDLAVNNCKNNLINLGSGVGYTIREYAEMICNIVDYDPQKIEYDTTKFTGVTKKVINTEKIDNLFKFKFTSIQEGLKLTINYYLSL